MPYSLSELADDVRSLLNAAPVSDCSNETCGVLRKADADFLWLFPAYEDLIDRLEAEA